MDWLIIVMGVTGVSLFGFILYNWRKQRDFEGTGHVPPEDYD
jgi:hypothetical protein